MTTGTIEATLLSERFHTLPNLRFAEIVVRHEDYPIRAIVTDTPYQSATVAVWTPSGWQTVLTRESFELQSDGNGSSARAFPLFSEWKDVALRDCRVLIDEATAILGLGPVWE
jgi:hypothetical protein